MNGVWREHGFEDFIDGTFGNSGQNLYVSRAGVLQRIHHFDLNKDGYIDLLFVNSQDNNERPPIYVYRSVFGSEPQRIELPSNGSYAAVLADLNGDGYQDLVIAMQNSGIQAHNDLNAYIYYGSPEGLTERYRLELPAPNCTAVAVGDFNGDGRPDIAFSSAGKLRVFYQMPRGFQFSNSVDLDIELLSMTASDLDGDGCDDLYVRTKEGELILWGGPDGLDPERRTPVKATDTRTAVGEAKDTTTAGRTEVLDTWKPKILPLHGTPHLFFVDDDVTKFVPVNRDRTTGEPLQLSTGPVISVALGDVNGDGRPDLVFAARQPHDDGEVSWIYWGTPDGFNDEHRTPLRTVSAREIALGDLTGNGCDDIVVCQGRTDIMYTTASFVYQSTPDGVLPEPLQLETHDATTGLVGRVSDAGAPEIVFINRTTGCVRANVPTYIYYGGPDGFREDRRDELVGWAAPDGICCDFNDDGCADVFVANCSENARELDPGSFIYWGGPDGFDQERKTVFPTRYAGGVVCGDIDRDGYLEIIVFGQSYADILIYHSGPQGYDLENPDRITMEKDGIVCNEPRWVLLADLTNDGWLDLVVPWIKGDRSFVLWGGPDGFSMERSTDLLVESGACARAADLTGNGYLDLLIGTYGATSKHYLLNPGNFESFVVIYWNGPDGLRDDRKMYLPSYAACSMAVADFNNDGVLDIFAGSYHGVRTRDVDSFIYWGKPGGDYSIERRARLFTHSASGCVAADFNDDGWIDLAVANHKTYGSHPGKSTVWWNGPEGFDERRTTWLPTLGPHGMVAVEPGNIMDRGPEEFYVSSPHQLPPDARVTRVEWNAECPPKTWVKAQLRFAATRAELTLAAWQGQDGVDTWFAESGAPSADLDQAGTWVQYRLALGAKNGGSTPRLTEVRVAYESSDA